MPTSAAACSATWRSQDVCAAMSTAYGSTTQSAARAAAGAEYLGTLLWLGVLEVFGVAFGMVLHALPGITFRLMSGMAYGVVFCALLAAMV
eukprot:6200527-Pleurochrysis_carterae.AAC.1